MRFQSQRAQYSDNAVIRFKNINLIQPKHSLFLPLFSTSLYFAIIILPFVHFSLYFYKILSNSSSDPGCVLINALFSTYTSTALSSILPDTNDNPKSIKYYQQHYTIQLTTSPNDPVLTISQAVIGVFEPINYKCIWTLQNDDWNYYMGLIIILEVVRSPWI